MRNLLDKGYWKCRLAAMQAVRKFQKEEKGASDIVAVLLLIVVIIAVAATFRSRLTSAIDAVFDKLTKAIG